MLLGEREVSDAETLGWSYFCRRILMGKLVAGAPWKTGALEPSDPR